MSTTELNTPSPRGLSLLRRNKGATNQSTNSLISPEDSTSDDPNENGGGGGLKGSLDKITDKVRKSIDERRQSADDGHSPHRRLSAIFKRKKVRGDGDAAEHRPNQHLGDGSNLASQDDSRSDLSALGASRSSSLMTDDIPGDEDDIVRPTLSAHPSHHGFLTLSSPAVKAETEPEGKSAEPVAQPSITGSFASLIPGFSEPQQSAINTTSTITPGAPDHTTPGTTTGTGDVSFGTPIARAVSEPSYIDSEDRPVTSKQRLIVSTAAPDSPASRPQTPQTFVTPPTPVIGQTGTPTKSSQSPRRSRALSGGNKLSKSNTVPLTPTVEEAKTPGGTFVQPNNAGGFFSSVFSVAQRAADSLSNTIVTAPVKSKEDLDPIVEDTEKMRSTTNLAQPPDNEADTKTEEAAAARAVSVAYGKAPAEGAANGRPTSIASNDKLTIGGDQSGTGEDGDALRRTGSVRSRISQRRHRGSSAATGNTIMSTMKGSSAELTHTTSSGHRMTGFAVASKKRNKDFHGLFRSVPEDDYLIEDYSAALQRDILLHGRLYVSEGHICFSSNILGWVTNLVMSFDEIVSVEKKSTAVIFPNALVIQTLQAKNTFASFVTRDSTYELIIGIWKINHPHLKSSLNGVALEDSGTGDKTEKAESVGSDQTDSESDDEFYDEDAEDDTKASYVEGDTTRSVAGSDVGDNTANQKVSAAPVAGDAPSTSGNTKAKEINTSNAGNSTVSNTDTVGPSTHAPTDCGDEDQHYDRPLIDTTIPAPLGKIYSLMWGPGSGAFMSKWLVDDQKSRELDLKDDKIGLDNDHKTNMLTYIKPLSAPVGPKQTKCITTNTLEAFNLEEAVIVSCSTQTPDVPSGGVFATKTRYCLMWGPNNSTRMIANCTIEWTGKSWLKGPIEKGAQDGQTQYVKDIVAALKAAVSTKTAAKGPPKKGRKKGKKDDADDDVTAEQSPAKAAEPAANWGPLEPVRGLLEPIVGLIRPFASSQVVIAVLFALLVYTWVSPPSRANTGVGLHGYTTPEQIAAYEQLWHREESELWDWLEDRVGLDDVHASKLNDVKQRQKVVAAREISKKLDNEKMNKRQLDDAIRTTEEKLEALKDAIGKRSGKAATEEVLN